MPPLRLAVDARVVAQDTRGIGRYARAILRRLAVRDDVALTLLTGGLFPARQRAALARALGSRAFDVRSRVPRDAQLIWHPANGTFFDSSGAPSIATIHDAVPFRYPDPDAARRAHAQQPFLRSARNAARVIAVSEFGAGELHHLLGIAREKIDVILHGVDLSFSPGAAEPLPAVLQGHAYILFVGDPIAEPRKNFDLLYDAHRRAWPDADGPLLAVIGPQAPQRPGIAHVGELGDDLIADWNMALRACYRGALALALASYHETFGMPMLEAMACGTPVIASHAGSLPEIGGDAALLFPSDDADAWAAGLRRVAEDGVLRERLRSGGLARAGEFSWDASAARHFELFCSVALRLRSGQAT
jgi:glycosyltransferase involved in cell wall biosynthesis